MHPLVFEQQVFPQRDKMFRFALRMLGNVEDAKDLVQDAMLKIWNQKTTWNEVQNAEAWCLQIIKNLCLDRLKAGKIRLDARRNLVEDKEEYATPYQQMEKKDNLERVRNLINNLPEKFRMTIHLRDVEGFSYKEISEILECSMDEVKINLFRARKMLKDYLIKNHEYGLS